METVSSKVKLWLCFAQLLSDISARFAQLEVSVSVNCAQLCSIVRIVEQSICICHHVALSCSCQTSEMAPALPYIINNVIFSVLSLEVFVRASVQLLNQFAIEQRGLDALSTGAHLSSPRVGELHRQIRYLAVATS